MHSASDFTSFASPLDDFFQKYIPREHEKALRSAFIQAVAIITIVAILAGLYYVYSILEPFCVPLLWAGLSGFALHPVKRDLTGCVRRWLGRLEREQQPLAVGAGLALLQAADCTAESIGAYFTTRWRAIVLGGLAVPVCLGLAAYTDWQAWLQAGLLVTQLTAALDSVRLIHLVTTAAVCLGGLALGRPEHSLICQAAALATWTMAAAYLLNFLWPPLVYAGLGLCLYSWCTDPPLTGDQPDGPDGRLRAVILSLLGRVGILQDEPDSRQTSMEATDDVSDSDTIKEQQTVPSASNIVTSTPLPHITEAEHGGRVGPLELGETPRLARIPQLNRVRAAHGLGRTGPGSAPAMSRSRVMGRTYFRLRRRPSLSRLGEESWSYIRAAAWVCAGLQLWLRPALAHLLPIPIAYHLAKVLAGYTGLSARLAGLLGPVFTWLTARHHLLCPTPVRMLARWSFSLERKLVRAVSHQLDSIVTATMILAMVLMAIVSGIFIGFQLYAESVYVVQSATSITSTLNMTDSYIFTKLNHSLADSMENVVDGLHNYGRDWISRTLQSSLAESDWEARRDLEVKVLELWDRSYQYFVLEPAGPPTTAGPTVTGEAISSSVGEVLAKLYSQDTGLNLSAVQTFVQNNYETITSILEQVWTLFKGNIGFLLETILGLVRIILHGGSGVVNFFLSIIIYLTALFYLLSNSTESYIPIEIISQYSIFQISGVGSSIQKAVNSVFLITVKMSSFYVLWTYVTHVVFGASIVVLPLLFSAFMAIIGHGQTLVAVPGAVELACLQERPLAALALVVAQLAPSWLVDTAIYSEMRGGLHPWFTGLAVVGGVYLFGVLGAVYGPLMLCVLYVIISVYSSFMAETAPDTPDTRLGGGTTAGVTLRSPLVRSGTVA